MAGAKILVVYYSRSGTTQRLAQAIAQELNGDLEEITETRSRNGLVGYLRSIVQARRQRPANILPRQRDLRSYDLAIVGTPVWAWSVSSPVRAFLANNRGRLPDVAFFCTCGASGERRAFAQMQGIVGKVPRATLSFTRREIEGNRFRERLMAFTSAVMQRRSQATAPSTKA